MEKELDFLLQSFEQLEELKNELKNQQAASEHLKSVTAALAGVSKQIGSFPAAFQKVVERAASTEGQLKAASASAQNLMESVPAIIERIERSDFGKSISLLSKEISTARAEVNQLRSMISEVHVVASSITDSAELAYKKVDESIQGLLDVNSRILSELNGVRLDFNHKLKVLASVCASQTEKLDKGLSDTVAAYSQLESRVIKTSENQEVVLGKIVEMMENMKSTDLLALSSQVSELLRKSDEQAQVIKSISSKKGFLFG